MFMINVDEKEELLILAITHQEHFKVLFYRVEIDIQMFMKSSSDYTGNKHNDNVCVKIEN